MVQFFAFSIVSLICRVSCAVVFVLPRAGLQQHQLRRRLLQACPSLPAEQRVPEVQMSMSHNLRTAHLSCICEGRPRIDLSFVIRTQPTSSHSHNECRIYWQTLYDYHSITRVARQLDCEPKGSGGTILLHSWNDRSVPSLPLQRSGR